MEEVMRIRRLLILNGQLQALKTSKHTCDCTLWEGGNGCTLLPYPPSHPHLTTSPPLPLPSLPHPLVP